MHYKIKNNAYQKNSIKNNNLCTNTQTVLFPDTKFPVVDPSLTTFTFIYLNKLLCPVLPGIFIVAH